MTPFVDTLIKHGIPFKQEGEHHHVTRSRINLDCPDCSPRSGHYRLGYHLQKNYLSCWVCGYRRIPDTLASLTGLPPKEFFHLLRTPGGPQGRPRREEASRHPCTLPGALEPLLEPHRRYLRGRGYTPASQVRKWGIAGIGPLTPLRWRIFIPIHHEARVVSWTTRSISDEVEDRYRSARADEEEVSARELLYGEDHCQHAIVVVEGPLDVWKVGFGAAATFGLEISPAQVLRMSKYPVRAICLDSQPEAQRKARWLLRTLQGFPGRTYNVVLESAKDPGAASGEELAELRKRFLER